MTPTRYQLTPVPFTAVQFSDPFWAPRIETNRATTIPHIYRKLEETGRISAFDLDFERPVPSPIVLIFGDSDPAKWIEAASYSLATHPDPELAGLVDRVADKVIAAQQPDGYLNTSLHPHPAGDALEEPAGLARAVLRGSSDRGRRCPPAGYWRAQAVGCSIPLCRLYRRHLWTRAWQEAQVTAVTPRSSWRWCGSTMRPATAATWNYPGISSRSAANMDQRNHITLTSRPTNAVTIRQSFGRKPTSIARRRCPSDSRKKWSVMPCGPCICSAP